ncbi:hypothetical protein OsJ_34922 [Oryza sativa Japonica Group]|uniref:DUF3615 domain-containing protein n=2 Tax=Oryza sativa subsp. japonica TaxID=39947 RepID=A0A8J8YQ36_ORYSJ|nr:hypothetical protein LOC_Os12g01410 [Oryza sativa Japonica Group]EAZ19369.1 hypothetical protein OsJ_34922 [Oryza sativa Japonica Group]
MKRRKIPNPQQQLGQIYVLPRRRQPHRGLHAAPWPPPPRPRRVLGPRLQHHILNALWYHTAYPLPTHQELPQDISDTRAMSPAPSTASSPSSVPSPPPVTHYPNMRPWSTQCDLTDKLQQQHTVTMTKKKNPYAAAAEASKHPQHTALGSFLLSLSGDGEKLDRLRHLLRSITDGSGRVISDADWEQLNAMMIQERLMITKKIGRKRALPPPSAAPHDLAELSKRRSAYVKRQRFARSNLEELLLKYCRQHPWEPRYKLDVICGLEEPKSYHWRSYHANFLASANGTNVLNGGEANPPVRKLFFAEFWDSQSGRFNKSNSKPICSPVQNYNACFGRLCSFCDEPRTILHPPCATGSHSNDDDDADADVIPDYNVDDAIRMYGSVAPELSEGRDLVESDIIYFDHEKDAANLTQVLNDPSFKEEDNNLGRRRKQ